LALQVTNAAHVSCLNNLRMLQDTLCNSIHLTETGGGGMGHFQLEESLRLSSTYFKGFGRFDGTPRISVLTPSTCTTSLEVYKLDSHPN
jgi:hypothetical protein